MPDERLEQLLDLYETRLAEGTPVEASELCQNCPELLEALQEKIGRLRRFHDVWRHPDFADSELPTSADEVCSPSATRIRASESKLTTTSRFVLDRLLASGGLGDVYVARDLDMDREVAIKFLRADRDDLPELILRFSREARITGRLDHPGVAPVIAMGIDSDQLPFYAMRLVGGKTLRSHITELHRLDASNADFPVGLRRTLLHFVSACKTVAYAHSKGIIHRDLKPMNIMLGEFGETILVDWGLAKEMETAPAAVKENPSSQAFDNEPELKVVPQALEFRTHLGSVVGTPGYMSPEQFQGEPNSASPASDIYSLGAVLFTILTGKSVFAGSTKFESLRRASIGDIPKPSSVKSGVPKPLEAVCIKAMALAPQDRYQSALELAHEVERFLADEPIAARKENLVEWAGRMLRRHRQLAFFTGLASVFTTLLLATGLLLLSREKNRTIQARDFALANLDTAVSAINDLYTEISENDLLNEPGAEELRKRLLEKALSYYELLRQQTRNSPQLELAVAQATFHVAEITASIHSPNQAVPIYEQSIGQLETIRQNHPSLEKVELLATAYNGLARTLFELQHFDEAEAWYEKSLGLFSSTENVHDGLSVERLTLLAGTLNSRGSNLISQGKTSEAMKDYDRAASILENLCLNHPNEARFLKILAANQSNRAVALRILGFTDDVLKMYESSLESYRRATQYDPGDDEARNGLATTEFNLANFLSATGHQDLALDRFNSSLETFRQLTRDYPLRVTYRLRLAKTFLNRGIAQARLGQSSDAEASFREALNRFQDIRRQYNELWDAAVDLVQVHVNLGNVIAGDHLERNPKGALEHYDQAISLATEFLSQDVPAAIRSRLQDLQQNSRQYRDDCENAQSPTIDNLK